MRRVLVMVCVLAAASVPTPTHAWGYDAHKFIMERALALRPNGLVQKNASMNLCDEGAIGIPLRRRERLADEVVEWVTHVRAPTSP